MSQKLLPIVSGGHLYLTVQQMSEQSPIEVGSPLWYRWLSEEEHRSFSFKDAQGTFTVRCERKRHGWYWYMYRKSGGRLYKAYLGKAEELTLARLTLIATQLVSHAGDNGRHSADEQESSEPHTIASEEHLSFSAPTITSQAIPEPDNRYEIPTPLTLLIGRTVEVTTVCDLLRQPHVRLLVLTGSGGIGKTRLALQVATELQRDFPAGVCFVSLEALREAALVAPTIARSLGVKETPGEPVLNQLKGFLREQALFLVLDNFEQVASAAPLLTELLASSRRLKILVSSRTRLHVRGEQEWKVPPLALPDPQQLAEGAALSQYAAVALFLQCVWALQPGFQISSASIHTIARICVHLEGVPLAIELAASRIKQLSPQALLAQLAHRLPLLTNGPQDAPIRQQALRQTLAWSYDLLAPREQWLFRHLSVFVSGCTLQAVEDLCTLLGNADAGGQPCILDAVASLVDASLLYRVQEEGEEQRFRMLEMTREYGQELLGRFEEREATRHAHALCHLKLAEQAASTWEGPQHGAWMERVQRDHDNLRTAMKWVLEQDEDGERLEMAFRFGTALRSFWQVRGYFNEGRAFLERILAHSAKDSPSWRSKALNDAALLAVSQGDHDWGESLCQENLLRCRASGDISSVARTLYLLGWIACSKCDFPMANARFAESLALSREDNDRGGVLVGLTWLGIVSVYQGEYAWARSLLEQALAMQRELANKRGIAWPLFHLAWIGFLSSSNLSAVYAQLNEAEALFKEIGDRWGMAESYQLLGQLALQQGNVRRARTLLEQSLTLYQEIDNRRGSAHVLSSLGDAAALQQDWTRARLSYEESLTEARKVGNTLEVASCLERVAAVVAAEGASLANVLWAAQLWGAAEVLREKMGAPLPPVERTTYKEGIATARGSVGKRIFAAYWAQGRTLSPEQAMAAQGKASPSSQPTTESVSRSPQATGTNHAALSAREVEVLRWVARGLTDAQVADRLVISKRTVTSHLSSIYNKLGVASRAAATRFAMEHQLV